jgi:hypothetical protein
MKEAYQCTCGSAGPCAKHPFVLDGLKPYSNTPPTKRVFTSGASRDTDEGKLDFDGFLSHAVLVRYAEYMHKNRQMADGSLRDSDNWQKGIPQDQYRKSMWRHFVEAWDLHRRGERGNLLETALCALLFNVMGLLHEVLLRRDTGA